MMGATRMCYFFNQEIKNFFIDCATCGISYYPGCAKLSKPLYSESYGKCCSAKSSQRRKSSSPNPGSGITVHVMATMLQMLKFEILNEMHNVYETV